MGRVKKKNEGYGYKYADLAAIHEYLESIGSKYSQKINVLADGREQIMTRIDDSEEWLPGCIVADAILSGKSNPAQEHGSALTYARRYSLLMAYGLATDDDDAESLNMSTKAKKKNMHEQITEYCYKKNLSLLSIAKEFGLKGMTEEELKPMFQAIKDKYGE